MPNLILILGTHQVHHQTSPINGSIQHDNATSKPFCDLKQIPKLTHTTHVDPHAITSGHQACETPMVNITRPTTQPSPRINPMRSTINTTHQSHNFCWLMAKCTVEI